MEVVGIESRSEDLIAAWEQHLPDVLVLYIRFAPGLPTGLTIAIDLKRQRPEARIVFLSQFDETEIIAECYRAKALAFVTKSAEPEVLIAAIESAAQGKRYFMPAMQERLMMVLLDGSDSPKSKLDENELKVFL